MLSVLNYTLIPLFTAFICIDVFGGEFADNTIKQTLTGPASRYKIFIAKILAISTFIIADLLFIMTASFFASFLINGTTMNIVKILTAYLVSFLPMLVFALAVIVISNTAKGTTSAFMFSVLLFLVFNGLEIVFSGYKSFFLLLHLTGTGCLWEIILISKNNQDIFYLKRVCDYAVWDRKLPV
jgi:ABC-2 type transport system permease protein